MSEVRQALPTISQLKYTVRPAERWNPTGYQNQYGREILQRGIDLPGIVVVITPYFGNIAMPSEIREFRSKKFLQDGLTELRTIEKPDKNVTDSIARIEEAIADPDRMWIEDIEDIAGIDDMEQAFAQAYSDALDEFPQLQEPPAEEQFSGIPFYPGLVQWDARLPWNGEQSILMKTGFFTNESLTGDRTIEEVKFESGATKRIRESNLRAEAGNIDRLNGEITEIERIIELKDGPQTPEATAELATKNQQFVNDPNLALTLSQKRGERDSRVAQKAQLEAVTYGSLPEFLQNPSVSSIAMNLTGAIFTMLKAKDPRWANLDLTVVLNRYALPDVS